MGHSPTGLSAACDRVTCWPIRTIATSAAKKKLVIRLPNVDHNKVDNGLKIVINGEKPIQCDQVHFI